MAVTVSCRADAARAWTVYVRGRGAAVLRILGLRRHELSLSLVDDAEIRVLNATYRGRDRATDVLAFALTEDAAPGLPLAVGSARHPVVLDNTGDFTRGRRLVETEDLDRIARPGGLDAFPAVVG